MFAIVLTTLCAVFVIGYIFFAASEQESGPAADATADTVFTRERDAA